MPETPAQTWWSAQELADAGLPDLPTSKRNVNALAERLGWRGGEHARKRAGRGGGWEYHWSLLPLAARNRLLAEAAPKDEAEDDAPLDRGAAWMLFDALRDAQKARARARLDALDAVNALVAAGTTRQTALEHVASTQGVSARTLWNWFERVAGVAHEDRLPYLATLRVSGAGPERATFSPEWFDTFKSDFLRLSRPSMSACHRRSVALAKKEGWAFVPLRTARRLFGAQVPREVEIFAREGYAGLKRLFPPQIRSVEHLHAMEIAQADFHRFDLMVEWPDGHIGRPQGGFFADVHSRMFLSVRVDKTPNKVAVLGAFRDMAQTYGLPKACLFDNGMEFANKMMTGGTKTRFRYKVREEDHIGLLPALGIKVMWATPGHGQAKPIERAFRDLADNVSRHPSFEGAWVGNRPDARPENWNERVIPLEEFLEVLAEGIREHNARLGRRTETAKGGSFAEAFARSYESAPIRMATPEQLRMLMLAQDVRKLQAYNGRLELGGNYYWGEWMSRFAGEHVTVRFDPDDLHTGVELYTAQNEYLGFAPIQEASGFDTMQDAQETGRLNAAIRRKAKALAAAHRKLSAKELATGQKGLHTAQPDIPEPKVLTASFDEKRPKVGKVRPAPKRSEAQKAAVIELQARKAQAKSKAPVVPITGATKRARFEWAMEIEARSDRGERLGTAEVEQYQRYIRTPEFQSSRALFDAHGLTAIKG